jgi:hypothetical protein
MDALILRDLMGHKSLRTTLQYAQVNGESVKKAFRAFDRQRGKSRPEMAPWPPQKHPFSVPLKLPQSRNGAADWQPSCQINTYLSGHRHFRVSVFRLEMWT